MTAGAVARARRLVVVATAAAGCLLVTGCGFSGSLRAHPGYARFGGLGNEHTDRDFALSLGPLPLTLARAFTKQDAELRAMLDGLKAVRVYLYTVEGEVQSVHARIETIRGRLVGDGWQPVVAIRDDGELIAVLVKMEHSGGGSEIRGVAALVQDDSDVILVNAIGSIRPESFSTLMAELDIELPGMSVASVADTEATPGSDR